MVRFFSIAILVFRWGKKRKGGILSNLMPALFVGDLAGGCGHGHAMTPEDIRHLRAVRRAARGGADDFGRLTEILGAHDRRADDRELLHRLAAEVIEAMRCAPRDAQRLPGTHFD